MQPKLVKHIVYPVHERLMRRPTFSYLESLERSQWQSRAEIESLQFGKLKELLQLAFQHCTWHARRLQEAGVDPNASESLDWSDLRRIPTMDKQDAQENREDMAWLGVPGGAYKYNTGGSSGQPLVFYFGRWRQASDTAGRLRAQRWWGIDPGDPQVWLWGAPAELQKTDKVKLIRDRLINHLFLNAFEMSPANMDRYIQAIQNYKPTSIYGYASSLTLLAARSRERKQDVRLPSLKAVFTTGEPVYPHQRKMISEVFGVPVANEFGSRDIGFTAHETPDNQMLLMSESHILEVLDPKGFPAPPGEYGQAVVTGLCSQAQPFIRYQTGDMVQVSEDVCRKGRGLHVLKDIAGRTTDFITRSDGTIMHALAVIYVLRAVEGVGEFKLFQHGTRDVEVLVVPNTQWQKIGRASCRERVCVGV